jgi:hypothetical protein
MTDTPDGTAPGSDGPHRWTYKVKLPPPTPGAERAYAIHMASIARWLEERRKRRLAGGQDTPTS